MSTSLNELPTNPTSGGNMGGGISMSISQDPTSSSMSNFPSSQENQQPQQQQQSKIDPDTINKLINGLQSASLSGATKIQSRDVPRDTINITQDPEILPTYIPTNNTGNENYINHSTDSDEIIQNYNNKKNHLTRVEDMYDEIHTPLLICILFFIFQLPFYKKFLLNNLRFLFNSDCNYNLYGFIFSSILFSMIFYIITMVMNRI